jgi:hypothetical protein
MLFIKHWYIDFVYQTDDEIQHKGIYGDWTGVKHSLKHGIATAVIVFLFTDITTGFLLGVIDAIIHYHTDYVKMRYGNRDIKSKQFWNHLGFDQLVHYSTYLFLICLIM